MSGKVPPLPEVDPADFNRLVLPDGRALAFTRFGDPEGFPAFYFHGTPSCRLEGSFAHAAACQHRIALIAVDRPGFGRSDFQPGRSYRDWPGDVVALADHLGFDRFGMAGHSGGGPHLMVCGAHIDPKRLAFIAALAPWGPLATEEIRAGINRLDRLYMDLAHRMPVLMRAAFAPVGLLARHQPKLFIKTLERSVCPADRVLLRHPQMRSRFAATEREAFRQGGRGAAHEALMAYSPWDFDLAAVQVPTIIWMGTDDVFVPEAMGRYYQTSVPGAQVHIVPGHGHFAIDLWDRLFEAVRNTI